MKDDGSLDCFYDNPVALMELDLSPVVTELNRLGSRRSHDAVQLIENGRLTRDALLGGGLVIRANEAMLSLLRAGSPEELSDTLPQVFPTDEAPSWIAPFLAMAEGRAEFHTRIEVHRLDGIKASVRLDFRRPSGDDALRHVLVAATEMDHASSFRRQIQALAMVPEINPNVVLMMECEDHITYANPTARRWLTEQGMTDLNDLHGLLPAGFRERHCMNCDRYRQRTDTYERSERLRDLKITPVVGENRCVLYVNDVTDTVKLQQERDTFRKAIEASGNAIAITDHTGAIEYVNPAFTRLYGYDNEQARGKNPRIVNPGIDVYWNMGVSREEYRALFQDMWQSLTQRSSWEGEVLNRAADGDLRWVHLIINRIAGLGKTTHRYLAVATDLETHRRRELDARLEILETITRVAELRDNDTGHHMWRVGMYSRLIAEQMGLPQRFCTDIERFAPMHDIGKVGIADEILLAPRRLTDSEFHTIKQHTTLGHSILAGKPSLEMAAEIARDHHERWDGNGYPAAKSGESIPLSAQITALADVYDALRNERPYKKPWTHEAARREIVSKRSSQFSPGAVDAFEALHREFRDIAERYRDD